MAQDVKALRMRGVGLGRSSTPAYGTDAKPAPLYHVMRRGCKQSFKLPSGVRLPSVVLLYLERAMPATKDDVVPLVLNLSIIYRLN